MLNIHKKALEQAPITMEVNGVNVSYVKDIGTIRIDGSKSGRNHELHVIQWLNLIRLDFPKLSKSRLKIRLNYAKMV